MNKSIPQLPAITTLIGSDLFHINRSNLDKKINYTDLLAQVTTDIPTGSVNPTDAFMPYNNAGVFADGYLKVNGANSTIVMDGTFINSQNLKSQIDTGSGAYCQVAFTDVSSTSSLYLDATQGLFDFIDGTNEAYLFIDPSTFTGSWTDGSDFGSIAISQPVLGLQHSRSMEFDAPGYDFVTLTPSTVTVINSSRKFVSSSVTETELPYLTGVTESLQTAQEGITAFAGGGQASATQIDKRYNSVDAVATSGDSVKFRAALLGSMRTVYNTTANDIAIFPAIGEQLSDAVSPLGVNNPITLGAETSITFICFTPGIWRF